MTEDQELDFLFAEKHFARVMLARYDPLEKQIRREHEHYSKQPLHSASANIEPLRVAEWIYYRKVDNSADAMTLYRFPVDELQRYGFELGQVPYLKGYEMYAEENKDMQDEHRKAKWE